MKKIVTVIFSALLYSVGAVGEEDYTQKLRAALPEFEMPPAWVTNHEPFRIIGNLYGWEARISQYILSHQTRVTS